MSERVRRVVGISIIVVALTLAVIGYLTLPDTLVVQLASGGAGNTLPKALGLLIPLSVSVVFAALFLRCAERDRTKYLLVSLLGLVIYAFTFIANG